jgi:phosphomethylpyrimidine synthase
LRLPTLADVREGVIASRIAAHIADIAKGLPGALDRDKAMAKCRNEFDWQGQVELSIDPETTKKYLEKSESAKEEGCTMCGEFCAIKLGKKEGHRR